MRKKTSHTGHVAYFDILGYSAMNSYEQVIRVWREITNGHKAAQEALAPECSYHLFGDSILVFCHEPLPTDQLFLPFCLFLFLSMFAKGLPVRGAIASGEFFEDGTIWAGKPIVDAHRCAERLGASACVATSSAASLVAQSGGYFSIQSVRLKNSDTKLTFPVLKFLKVFDEVEIRCKFLKHGKSVDSEEVQRKMQSTLEVMKAVGTVSHE